MAHSSCRCTTTRWRHSRIPRSPPEGVILLIDTYDTEAGARKVVERAPRLQADGIAIRGVRIDSGNLADMARRCAPSSMPAGSKRSLSW